MTSIEISIRRSGYKALISEEDYELVSQYKWYLYPYQAPTLYCCTSNCIYMHRLIHPSPKGLVTAHRNENGLDNRRSNLFTTTELENLQWKRTYSNNTSGVTGVKYKPRLQKWEVQITAYKKRIYLGVFKDFQEACEARFAAELKYKPNWNIGDEE